MKVEERIRDVTDHLGGEKVRMSFHEGSIAFLQGVMIDLYSNKVLAVIREYSTNALDAHKEIGLDRPIDVTLPSPLSLFFRVRDYGLGLDKKDIIDVYSQYGASTKRHSNDVVGMLGLGCKSALSYSDQFTLKGIKAVTCLNDDGVEETVNICTEVSISRDEDGGGSMNVVAEFETDKPTGVEVVVPVIAYNSFENECRNFFRFWDEGTVLINGEVPKRIDGDWLTDDLLLSRDLDRSYIVMGNVPYPFPTDAHYSWGNYRVAAFVNIGDVNFTPSREQLELRTKTKDKVAEVVKRVNEKRREAMQAKVDAALTYWDAIEVAREIRQMNITITHYKGEEILDHIKAPEKISWLEVSPNERWGGSKGHKLKSVSSNQLGRTIWIKGYEAECFSPHKRKKLRQWLDTKSIEHDRNHMIVFVNKMPKSKWINPATIYPWKEIEDQKITINYQRDDGRPSGSYEGWIKPDKNSSSKKDNKIMAANIDTSKPLFYAWAAGNIHLERAILASLHPSGFTFIELAKNRIAKFQRDFPMAKELTAVIRDHAQKWHKRLTPKDKATLIAYKNRRSHQGLSLKDLKADRIDDPDLKLTVEMANEDGSKLLAKWDMFSSFLDLKDESWLNPLEKYPLCTELWYYGKMNNTVEDHIYLYLNAAYAAAKEQ